MKQYLELVQKVLNEGAVRVDRTGTGTKSIFGAQLRFDLKQGFPLVTTKQIHFKHIVNELLWFISGSTDVHDLEKRGTHIWSANSKAHHESMVARGDFGHVEGDLGPIYGHQWRSSGPSHIDQLANCIHLIKTSPFSRRIIMSSWNPSDIEFMALPPCHTMVQFYVSSDGKRLSSHMYQRSGDVGLGVPFNIASYALLTHLVAHVCGLEVGEYIHSFGDVHVYLDHEDALCEQLTRRPFPLPTLNLHMDAPKEIDEIVATDITLGDYKYHPRIAMAMSI